jgi:peptidoglycan-associated lipoprotein
MRIEIILPTAIALFAGCAGRHEEALTPVSSAPSSESASAEQTPPSEAPAEASGGSRIVIAESILTDCGITANDAHFDFDSSVVKVGDQNVLSALATCLSTGPLAGRQLMLVGHADERGTEAYNQTLGQQRADSVSRYLSGGGMSENQLFTNSRGEQDATGSAEASWAQDRRVDVTLRD